MPKEENPIGSTTSLSQTSILSSSRQSSDQASVPLTTRKTSDHTRKRSEVDHGPLGLTVVFTPENVRKVDLVFVHGLGGYSRKTWSKYEDPELFWPSKFLPLEPDVCRAKILTFGYNANFRGAGNIGTSVLDFAKDLLFDLKYAKDEQSKDLNIGTVSETC